MHLEIAIAEQSRALKFIFESNVYNDRVNCQILELIV